MLRVLIALSLSGNIVLALVFWRDRETGRHASAVATIAGRPSGETAAGPNGAASPTHHHDRAADAAMLHVSWSMLPTGDLEALTGRLRTAGFPPAMIRAVISGLLGMEYAARRRELTAGEADLPYWQDESAKRDPKVRDELQKLSHQHARILRELLGSEPISEADDSYYNYRRLYGDLPADKIARVRDIDRDYAELTMRRVGDLELPGEGESRAMLAKEKEADLAAVLTPAELEEFQLRSSPNASRLRWMYAAFEPTEAEFRALYHAARSVDDKLGPLGDMISNESLQQRTEAMKAELESVLAPERIEELTRLSDFQYSQTARLVARLRLPPSTTRDVVEIQRQASGQAEAIRGDRDLNDEARRVALEQLSRETSVQLIEKLGGQRGLDAYRLNGGSWVDGLRSSGANGRP